MSLLLNRPDNPQFRVHKVAERLPRLIVRLKPGSSLGIAIVGSAWLRAAAVVLVFRHQQRSDILSRQTLPAATSGPASGRDKVAGLTDGTERVLPVAVSVTSKRERVKAWQEKQNSVRILRIQYNTQYAPEVDHNTQNQPLLLLKVWAASQQLPFPANIFTRPCWYPFAHSPEYPPPPLGNIRVPCHRRWEPQHRGTRLRAKKKRSGARYRGSS